MILGLLLNKDTTYLCFIFFLSNGWVESRHILIRLRQSPRTDTFPSFARSSRFVGVVEITAPATTAGQRGGQRLRTGPWTRLELRSFHSQCGRCEDGGRNFSNSFSLMVVRNMIYTCHTAKRYQNSQTSKVLHDKATCYNRRTTVPDSNK